MAKIRSQVSFFIILGLIILLFLAFLIFIINPDFTAREMDDSVIFYMENCIEDKALEALLMAGKTGGKFEENFLFTGILDNSQFYTKSELEQRIENYLLSTVKKCAEQNISGNQISMNETSITVSLENRAFFEINNAYSVVLEDNIYHQDKLLFDFDIRFDEIYEIIEHVLDNKPHVADKGSLKNEGFKIEFIESTDHIICAITDTLASREYIFTFAFEK
ncbi:MAG: hypothetical protein ACOCZQ_01695 [Nanoarchaeota archaeon]